MPETSLFEELPFFHVKMEGSSPRIRGVETALLGLQVLGQDSAIPDGIFGEWQWDGSKLTARNDRYGMYPLFYFERNGEFCISPSIFRLVAEGASTEINWPGLSVFLRMGFFANNDTVFRDIHILPPAAKLIWKAGIFQLTGGYHLVEPQEWSRDDAIEAYISLFRSAIAKRLPGDEPMALPLSGGRDSRHILFELDAQGHLPQYCITGRRFPPDRYEDERIAGLLCKRLGINHLVVGPPPRQVHQYLRANIKTNMTAPRRGWKFAYADELKSTVTVSYDGIGGDMLSGGSAIDSRQTALIEEGKYEEFCRLVFRRSDVTLKRLIPAEQMALLSTEAAIERLLEELPKHAGAANPATSFYFWNRTRRFDSTNPYGMLGDIPTVHAPYLDHNLYDFFASLPASFNMGRWFHDEVLEKAFPQYADIPFELTNPPLTYSPSHARQTTRELIALGLHVKPHYLVRGDFLWPRLAMRMATFGWTTRDSWFIPMVVYLAELESIVTQPESWSLGSALQWR